MKITLIHNAKAGSAAGTGDSLVALLRDAGHEVRYQAYGTEGWEQALEAPADAIAVAGGDGTVGRVAKRLGGRGVPLAPLPAGTANNIARALKLTGRPYEELARGWEGGRRVKLDIGEATGPWGRRYVIEGVGAGLFAGALPFAKKSEAMKDMPHADAKVAYMLQMLKERVETAAPVRIDARLDGEDVSGEFLLFEAMIMPLVGPNLFLGPDSAPGDGRFELVMATVDQRDRLRQYLASWQEQKPRVPVLPSRHGRSLDMRWRGFEVHVDDELWPAAGERPPDAPIELALKDIAVEFLVADPKRRRA